MHKVFINNKPLIFEYVYDAIENAYDKFLVLSDSEFSLNDVLDKLNQENVFGIVYLCARPDISWNEFTSRYVLMEAAGGVVINPDDEILVIYRKKKWDLPKGKLDYRETPEAAAVREVKEECGVKDLQLDKFLLKTFHTYTEKNKYILKKTHWFTMSVPEKEDLIPQVEEDIEEARWMNKEKIQKKFFQKTYESIIEVLETYFKEN